MQNPFSSTVKIIRQKLFLYFKRGTVRSIITVSFFYYILMIITFSTISGFSYNTIDFIITWEIGFFLFMGGFFTIMQLVDARRNPMKGALKFQRNENSVKGYTNHKKLIYYAITILSIFIVIQFILSIIPDSYNGVYWLSIVLFVIQIAKQIQIYLMITIFFSFVYLISYILIKEHRLLFAKECIKIGLKKNDQIEKTYYIIQSIKWYNEYIKNSLNIQLNNINRLFDKIVIETQNQEKLLIDMDNAMRDNNKLGNIKILNAIYTKFVLPGTNFEPFIIEYTYLDKIKGFSNFIIPIIAIIISIIGVIHGK